MAAAQWKFVLTDSTYVPIAEIVNADDRKVAIPLNKIDSCSFKVRLDNPIAPELMTASRYVKGYRNNLLTFYGPIVTAEEVGDANGASVAVTCQGAGWVFQKRLVGKSRTGTVYTSTDRAGIINALITVLNAENQTGIGSAAGNTAASVATYTAGPYKMMSEVLADLSSGTAGFDWRILPNENFVNGAVTSQTIGAFYARPTIGSVAPEAVFEWGGGRNNVSSYNRTMSRDGQADRVFHYTSQGPDVPGYPTIFAESAPAITEFKLLEDVVQGDLLDSTMRTALVNQHVAVRAYPRHIVTFAPHIDPEGIGRVPDYDNHYTVGDQVRMRVQYNSIPRIDTLVRVWGASFEIDKNGVERTSMVLAEE